MASQHPKTDRMTAWRSPSGRLHGLRGCTGGGPVNRMRKVRVTQEQFDEAVRCRCLRSFRAEAGR